MGDLEVGYSCLFDHIFGGTLGIYIFSDLSSKINKDFLLYKGNLSNKNTNVLLYHVFWVSEQSHLESHLFLNTYLSPILPVFSSASSQL